MEQIHRSRCLLLIAAASLAFLCSCGASEEHRNQTSVLQAQKELRAAIQSIADDAMSANIEGLQAIHLDSDRFSKFGPRSFTRQDVRSTNESEAAFFSSVTGMNYEVQDLKIDVFDDVGIVTYYPHVTFVKEGERREVQGRQTLVFLKTSDGWKIIHEHGTIRQ